MPDEPSQNGTYADEFDFAAAIGAQDDYAAHCFSIYIPNKDQDGEEFGNQRKWVLEAVQLLAELSGGATAMPAVEGVWRNDGGSLIREHPVVVYSYVRPTAFRAGLPRVREFLHRMGRETNQGEIAVEFQNRFYRIRVYDPPALTGGPK